MTPHTPRWRWEEIGAALKRRRTELHPDYRNRSRFARDTGLNARLIADIEHARRTVYRPDTLRAVEHAYQLQPGSIDDAITTGPPLRPADPPRPTWGSGEAQLERLPVYRLGSPPEAVDVRDIPATDWHEHIAWWDTPTGGRRVYRMWWTTHDGARALDLSEVARPTSEEEHARHLRRLDSKRQEEYQKW